MPDGKCRNCGAEFHRPSFSEGPKVEVDGEFRRFGQAEYQCPECFSDNVEHKGVKVRGRFPPPGTTGGYYAKAAEA